MQNLSIANANNLTNHNAAAGGIVLSGSATGTINRTVGNTIHNLSNSFSGFTGQVSGIYFFGNSSTTNVCARNFIHSLSVTNSSAATIIGIIAQDGQAIYSNNIVSIGDYTDNSFYGFLHNAGSCNLYHNSIYIWGEPAFEEMISAAFRSNNNSLSRNFRNNIFYNARSNDGASGTHYAAYFNYTSTGNLTNNFNNYFVSGTGGVLTYYNNAEHTTLADFRIAMGQDAKSRSLNPNFANAGGTAAVNYVPNNLLTGDSGTGITTDYSGSPRNMWPTMGAFENLTPFYFPVEIWKAGAIEELYENLSSAFNAINNGSHTGVLEIKITGNIDETASVVLNASGTGSANYSSIIIYPTVTGISISGNLTSPLIDLNGADNVTIDGRINASGNIISMSFVNRSTASQASTLTLRSDANNNRIRYVAVQGSTRSNVSAVIFVTSSSNNTIEFCNITSTTNSNRPIYTIFLHGTSSNNSILNNNIYDVLNRENASKVIYINPSDGHSNNVIGNSFYETNPFMPTGNHGYAIIEIDNSSGYNNTVLNNYIGGSAPLCGGNPWVKTGTTANDFHGLRLISGASIASSVQGNTVANITWDNVSGATFIALGTNGNSVNVGTTKANTIGSHTLGSISITTHTGSTQFFGILYNSNHIFNCQNNIIENIKLLKPSGATIRGNFYGIYRFNEGAGSSQNLINGNRIGSLTHSNSIYTNCEINIYGIYSFGNRISTVTGLEISNNTVANITSENATLGELYAIYASDSKYTIRNNTIFNLKTAVTNTTDPSPTAIRLISSSTHFNVIANNTIYNLTNSHLNFNGRIAGISSSATTSALNHICNNHIHSSTATGANANAVIIGILANSGTTNYYNNIINIGDNTANTFYGFYDTGSASQTCNLYFNTIYIGGQPSFGSNNSAALWSHAANNVRNYRNNIFHNSRSNNQGATGTHYAAYYNYNSNTNLTNNFNNYFTTGTGGVLAYYNTANRLTLAELQSAMGRDINSMQLNSRFVLPDGLFADSYKALRLLRGTSIAGFTTDFSNSSRPSTPQIGAWERVPNYWVGIHNNDWNTESNWASAFVPYPGDDVYIHSTPQNHAVMDQNRIIGDLINAQSVYRVITNGYKLTVNGSLQFSNGAQIEASTNGSTIEFAGAMAQSMPAGCLLNNQVYNLTVNNSNNLSLLGTLNLLNLLTTNRGQLNAISHSPTLVYGGMTSQSIEANQFTSGRVHNLTIDNAAGVTLNSTLEIDNSLTINSGKRFTIAPDKQLKVNGTLTNNAGTSGLVIASTAAGTGSLIHNTNNVQATVNRYVHGTASNWHFVSSPVNSQEISGEWTPPGTYGDGTGYDLFVWDETNICWVYNLNNSVAPTWLTVHPQSQFVPGRGYLYSFQEHTPTKQFKGNLNNGTVGRDLTVSSSGEYAGFNYIGNPYPSSVDWKDAIGFNRSMLFLNEGGYDIWIWNPEAGNYGVYNSASTGDIGTNGISRYIAPMQGFFVRASIAGQFQFNNNARCHTGASAWKISSTPISHNQAFISVTNAITKFSDEIKLTFDSGIRETGALKLFSHHITAPSLYITEKNRHYSVFSPGKTEVIDLSFKPGSNGDYVLLFRSNTESGNTIILEDKFLKKSQDFTIYPEYRFKAFVSDNENRFRLHFSNQLPTNKTIAKMYFQANKLIIDITALQNNYNLTITDTTGRIIINAMIEGGKVHEQLLAVKGVFFVHLEDINGHTAIKSKIIH